MSLDNIPLPKQAEKLPQYKLLNEHQRGSMEPIPAGTTGTAVSPDIAKPLDYHRAVAFAGFGTYYVHENSLEEIVGNDSVAE